MFGFVVPRATLVMAFALAPFTLSRTAAAERSGGAALYTPRGVVSQDDENEDNEIDPKFRPNIITFQSRAGSGAATQKGKSSGGGQKATGSAASSGTGQSSGKLKDHPNAQKYAKQLQ